MIYECGGCRGLGAHGRGCVSQPGWWWYRLGRDAANLADSIGSNDVEAANMAYEIAARMNKRCNEAREAADVPNR